MKLSVTKLAIDTIKDMQKDNNADVTSLRLNIEGFG